MIYVRLPRVLSAVLAGGALACAGALLQCMLGNRLASPGIIGVNAGSGLFSLMAILMFPASTAMAAWGAFIGALVAMVLVFVISGTGGISTPGRVILTGVAVSSLFTALLDTVVVLRPDLQMDRLAFSLGGFTGADMPSLLSALPFFVSDLSAVLCSAMTGIFWYWVTKWRWDSECVCLGSGFSACCLPLCWRGAP